MKKNRMMRLASVLLVCVLLTTSVISGTFAKYVTEAETVDEARVAKWGVTATVTAESFFATEYEATETANDSTGAAIAKTVISSTADKLVAPGTSGTLGTTHVTGTPEVAVNVKREATLDVVGWEVDDAFYCPIVITMPVDATTTWTLSGLDYTSADDFEAAVAERIASEANYAPNTDLSTTCDLDINWAWAIEGADGSKQTNEKDTALGDLAAAGTAPTIEFTLTVTVTQID